MGRIMESTNTDLKGGMMTRTKRVTSRQRLMRNACRLLRAAGLGPHPAALIRLIRSCPASTAEADAGPSEGFCAFCLLTAEASYLGDAEYRRFRALAAYFLDELPTLSPSRRERLTRDVVAMLAPLVEA
jgi:hypothetical protein